MPGAFTISLDFELHWGGFEKWSVKPSHETVAGIQNQKGEHFKPGKNSNAYFLNTRNVIPEMLSLFKEFDIHVTWATVGMLCHNNRTELAQNSPSEKPTYKNKNLSAYQYIDEHGIGENEKDDPFHFAPSLVKLILETPNQELGTHTFAHYYCNEEGQTGEQFRQDLRSAQRIAATYNRRLTSLVFPRNQFNDQYLKICFEEGITAVRSNPLDWFWHIESTQDESKWKRLNRGLDAYLPIGKKNTYALSNLKIRPGFPMCLPASRLLRPYNPSELFLNTMKVARIKFEMERAARNGEVYHLWWHPHNFGNYPLESLLGLKSILQHYNMCREKFGMQSLSMAETVLQLQNGK